MRVTVRQTNIFSKTQNSICCITLYTLLLHPESHDTFIAFNMATF
jgi:hypothetical protein